QNRRVVPRIPPQRFFGGCGGPACCTTLAPSPNRRVRVSHDTPSFCADLFSRSDRRAVSWPSRNRLRRHFHPRPLRAAHRNRAAQRILQRRGLEVRKVVVRTNLQAAALIAGELDYSTVSGNIARASIQGLPVRGVMGWFDRPLHILIARPGFKKLSDFKNRKIGVSSIGSAPHIILREALAQAGMNPDRD